MWLFLGSAAEAIEVGDQTIVLTNRMVFDAPTSAVASLIRRQLVVYIDRDRAKGHNSPSQGHRHPRAGVALGLKIRIR
jgi:hypothetical protein